MILDLAVIGAVVLAFIISARRGLVKSVWKIAALVVTIVLVMALRTPVTEYLSRTKLADTIYYAIGERLSISECSAIIGEKFSESDEDDKNFLVPQFVIEDMIKSGKREVFLYADHGTIELMQTLTDLAIQIIATVALFIIIRIFLMAAFMVLDGMSKLPLINQANALLGGLLGVVNILAVIYIACALLSLFAKSEVVGLIEQSYIVKYFYNYNILLQLIMKI